MNAYVCISPWVHFILWRSGYDVGSSGYDGGSSGYDGGSSGDDGGGGVTVVVEA